MNSYHLIPGFGKRPYKNEEEVKQAWADGIVFRVLSERASYMNSRDYENYCNPMDGVFYCYDGLHVQLESGII